MMALPDIPRRRQTSHSGLLAFLSRILFAYSRNEIHVTYIYELRRFNIIASKLEIIIAIIRQCGKTWMILQPALRALLKRN